MATTQTNDAFWQSTYQSHGSAVLAFLLRRVGRRSEAEDLLQETFLRAMDAGTFRQGSNVRAYLLRTARNLWINRMRRPRLVVAAEPPPDDGQTFSDVATDESSPAENAAGTLLKERVDSVLAQMTEAHRTAFEMAVLEQRPYSEVSRLTGWSLPRVKSNVHRARRRLIDELADYLPQTRGIAP
jgi:RNA polymerase sigma-70 factor (ECF subfamily)